MRIDHHTLATRPQVLFIILFSISTAYFLASLVFMFSEGARSLFNYLEVRIRSLLGQQPTDLIGEIAIVLATLIIVLPLAAILLKLRSSASGGLLGSRSIAVLLFTPPLYWFIYYQFAGWPFGWPYRGAPLELLLVWLSLIVFARTNKNTLLIRPLGIVVLTAHFGFWYFVPSTNTSFVGYREVAPVLGFVAGLTWCLLPAGTES